MTSRWIGLVGPLTFVLLVTTVAASFADVRANRAARPDTSTLPFPDRGGPTAKAAIDDPTDDTFGAALDITRFEAVASGGVLTLGVDFTGDVTAPDSGGPTALDGFIDLDVDQDGSTGDLPWTDLVREDGGSTGLGNEYYVDLAGWSSVSNTVEVWNDATEQIEGFADATLVPGRLEIRVPLSMLGGDDGAVDTAVVLGYFLDFSDLAPNSGSLSSDATGGSGVLLQGDRFRVDVEWNTGAEQDVALPVVVSDDSAVLYFFDPENWEMLIKVLDGCAMNDRFWVFFAATTDVGFTVTVTDTATDQVSVYTNPLGSAADAVNDTDAFATCP